MRKNWGGRQGMRTTLWQEVHAEDEFTKLAVRALRLQWPHSILSDNIDYANTKRADTWSVRRMWESNPPRSLQGALASSDAVVKVLDQLQGSIR